MQTKKKYIKKCQKRIKHAIKFLLVMCSSQRNDHMIWNWESPETGENNCTFKSNMPRYSIKFEPWHEISNNVVCTTSKASDQPAHTRSLITEPLLVAWVFWILFPYLFRVAGDRKRILGECLLISSLPGKAMRTLVDIARLAERFNMRSQSRAW